MGSITRNLSSTWSGRRATAMIGAALILAGGALAAAAPAHADVMESPTSVDGVWYEIDTVTHNATVWWGEESLIGTNLVIPEHVTFDGGARHLRWGRLHRHRYVL